MNWPFWILVIVVVAAWLLWKKQGQIRVEEAVRLRRKGATVVDVRSAGEFAQDHLPGVSNVPLGEVTDQIPRQFPDRNTVLLLHCLSGTRSGMAQRRLKALGYQNTHNLGSFHRAKTILAQATTNP